MRERFDAKWVPEPNTGCWLWTGHVNDGGYGRFARTVSDCATVWQTAHRLSWELHRGPIPDGLHIDHMCRVRSCVNPDHLRVVTPRQNSLENSSSGPSINVLKSHCIHGHPFAGDNLAIRRSPNGADRRVCLTCHRLTNRKSYRNGLGAGALMAEPAGTSASVAQVDSCVTSSTPVSSFTPSEAT